MGRDVGVAGVPKLNTERGADVLVRVKFDGNLFHPAEGLLKKICADLLHSYCLERDRYIQAFGRLEIFCYSAITVAPFSPQIALKFHF